MGQRFPIHGSDGSPFLLAHGLGVPVQDAVTVVQFPTAGTYRVWVRTRNWVATWNAPGAPGRFQVLVNGQPLEVLFGTDGSEWYWQDGGTVQVPKDHRRVGLSLHDLTGFEGRCDALLFATDFEFVPPADELELAAFRRKLLGLPERPVETGNFDLVVVGGGTAGTCASLSAARLGLRVALIQDRPVLGGNNSSEVRVWLQGARNKHPYPRVGDIVRELEQKRYAHYGPTNTADLYEDDRKLALVRAEKNLSLYLRHRADGVEKQDGRIRAVLAQNTVTAERIRFAGRWFADCTGDGCIGFLAKADYDITLKGHLGRCNLWNVIDTGEPAPFPRCPWALDLSEKPFPGRAREFPGVKKDNRGPEVLGGWYWESGFDHDPFEKNEYIRDWNFRAMYGAWDTLKNVDHRYPTFKLNWAAHVAGKRESRRLLGDVILSKDDVLSNRQYPDGCVPTGWSIDLHLPDERYDKGFENDAFIAKAQFTRYKTPYWIPYRCLYSRNVANLFMAGRDISVTHEALGTVRVMRTGGCMGEIVGMAASLCREHQTDPRNVYDEHLDALKNLMRRGVGKSAASSAQWAPPEWLANAGSNLALTARVQVSGSRDTDNHPPSLLHDGYADPSDNSGRWLSHAQVPHCVELSWDKPQTIGATRVISGYCESNGVAGHPIESFVFEWHDGDRWQPIAATAATDNDQVDWHSHFSPVITRRIRLSVTKTRIDVSRIWEIELYAGAPSTDP